MQQRKRQSLAYLLIIALLFMLAPPPANASTGNSAPTVIDDVIDVAGGAVAMSTAGLSQDHTGILYATTTDNWTTMDVSYKVLDLAGNTRSNTNISSLMGARATNVSTFATYAIADGKTVITWEGTTNGCGGAYQFVILDLDGSVVKGATDISTVVAPYNCYTGVTELSNGNIAFMWQNLGDEYLYRIFDAAGNALTNPASIEKGGSRQDNFPTNSTYTHSLAANDQGQFLITYNIYQNYNYIGAMYDNDGARRLTNGFHHFYLGPKLSNDGASQAIGLAGGRFGVAMVDGNAMTMQIIDSQGSVQNTITSGLRHDDGYSALLPLKSGGFLVYDTSTANDLSYLYTKHYDNDGVLLQDWTARGTEPVLDFAAGYYYWFSSFIFAGYDSGFGYYNTVTNQLVLHDMGTPVPPTPVAIVGQPANASVIEGEAASFTVSATDALAYQWQVNTGLGFTDIADGGVYSGTSSETLQITGANLTMNGYMFRVVAEGADSSSEESSGATLTVLPLVHAAAPTITGQPADLSVTINGNATLSVTASAGDGGTLSYQWYSNATNSNNGGSPITGATAASYSAPTDTEGTTYYYVVVTNTNLGVNGTQTAITASAAAAVATSAAPSFTVSPAGNVNLGALPEGYNAAEASASGQSITLNKVGSAAIENLAVQLSGGAGTGFSTGTVNPDSLSNSVQSTTFILAPKTNLAPGTHTETVMISADGGLSETFQVSFTVNPTTFGVSETGTASFGTLVQGYTTAQINAIKKDITLTKIGRGAIPNLSVTFSGGAGSSFTTGTVLPNTLEAGVESAVLQVFPKTGLVPGIHSETVTISADGGISHSFQVVFNVTALVNAQTPTISFHPMDETVDKNDSVLLDVAAWVNDGGELLYQWFSNTTASTSDGTEIQDANGAFYQAPTDTAGTTYYYAAVINMNNGVNGNTIATAISDSAKVTVLEHAEPPVIGTQPVNAALSVGDNSSLNVSATSADGGALSYQWYRNVTNSVVGGTSIPGAQDATFAIPASAAGTYYYYAVVTNTNVLVNGNNAASLASGVAQVIVHDTFLLQPMTDVAAPALVQGYDSAEPYVITLTNGGSGTLANIAVALSGSDAGHFELTQPAGNLPAGASATFTVTAKQGLPPGTYSATVTVSAANMADESFAFTQAVSSMAPPSVPQNPSATNGNAQATLTWDMVAGAAFYQIYEITEDDRYTLIDTVASPPYSLQNLANGTSYRFAVNAGNPGGLSGYSSPVQVKPATVPASPGQVVATAGNRQATVAFVPPTDNGGSEISGYEVIASPGNITATGTSSPIVVQGLSNGVAYTFAVKAINAAGESEASLPSAAVTPQAPPSGGVILPPAPTPPSPPANDTIEVLVNGKIENAGTVKKETVNGRLVATIIVDEKKMLERLEAEGDHAVLTIPYHAASDVIIGEISGQLAKALEDRQATIVLRTENAAYHLPAKEIKMESAANQLGSGNGLSNTKLLIEIATPVEAALQQVQSAVAANALVMVAPPYRFSVRAVSGDASVEVDTFGSYVERTIRIPASVDPKRITTGIVIEADGSIRHVPTNVEQIEGQYYARIKSLTNSDYAVIWNTVEYGDTISHWASESIHNMGSRLIVNGVGENRFAPDRDITRAEFASIVVRALGLKLETPNAVFDDVATDAWYGKTVQTAYAYKLIDGFEDGTFRPQESITRQQAMLMISKAMKLTELKGLAGGADPAGIVGTYDDSELLADWAVAGVADAIASGIVSGRSNNGLAPLEAITRAEVAVMIERLLQNSELINKNLE